MILRLLSLILIAFAWTPASAAELLREFSGTAGTTTTEFEVEAPWILDWRVNSDYRPSMAIEVHLVDGVTGLHEGLLLKIIYPDPYDRLDGVKLFDEGGRYRFRVSSTFARWNLKVIELTEDEAALYTPR
ncbi:MAG: hypothetical protein R3315_02985 [Woeseiaceae bacterium]|nr:hypothetical protein [Woeseiaceae bacterium]